jgi:hypothetical protein
MSTETNTCPICLDDLVPTVNCKGNTSGVKRILYGLKEDVLTFPAKIQSNLRTTPEHHVETAAGSNLTMKQGKKLYTLFAKKATAELKYELEGESLLRSRKVALEVYVPNMNAKLTGVLAEITNRELVILATLKNGEVHMLGNEDEGAELETDSSASGKATTDPNGASIVFSVAGLPAATIYKGATDHLTAPATTTATSGSGA